MLGNVGHTSIYPLWLAFETTHACTVSFIQDQKINISKEEKILEIGMKVRSFRFLAVSATFPNVADVAMWLGGPSAGTWQCRNPFSLVKIGSNRAKSSASAA